MIYCCFVEMTKPSKNIIVNGFMEAQSEEEASGMMIKAARIKLGDDYSVGCYSANLIPLDVIKRSIHTYEDDS